MFEKTSYKFSNNCWSVFVQDNINLISDKNKKIADIYCGRTKATYFNNFTNVFEIDGWSADGVAKVVGDIYNKKYIEKIQISSLIKKDMPTIFHTYCEAFSSDEFFIGLHKLIEILDLQGKIVYYNCAVNAQEVYDSFCDRNNVAKRVECYYNGNLSYSSITYAVFTPPDVSIEEKSNTEKKLYCTYNWNAWDHRLGLIALLNYYDLIDHGNITSPGNKSFSYDKESDYILLVNGARRYLSMLPDCEQIIEKLTLLKENYPLIIDDRTKYHDKDIALQSKTDKIPLVTARKNSLFEIVAETKFCGEHFFSEKTYYPICTAIPFFILSSHNALKSIRKLGYKTFSPLIDESYDDIKEDQYRLLAIVKEMVRIKNYRESDPINFYKWYDEVKVIAKYNNEIFVNNSYRPNNYSGNLIDYVNL